MNQWTALRAGAFLMIGGVLFLPNLITIDLPVLPPLNKYSVVSVAVWLGCLLCKPDVLKVKDIKSRVGIFVLCSMLGALLTALTNRDALQIGPITKQPMGLYDGFVIGLSNIFATALPFYLGHRLVRTADDLRYLLKAIIIGSLIYVPLILIEGRLAPFLHRSVYGYFQHDWSQTKREGGFRAFAFMSHALTVAFYTAQSTMISAGISRLRHKLLPISGKLLSFILFVSLVACKSMAALTYAIVGAPIMWFLSAKSILRASRWLGLIALTYPFTRLLNLFPLDWLLEKFIEISPDRAESLAFRFYNESALLEKAAQRLFFGWGGWGRNRQFDLDTGANLSTVDGQWIIELGAGGLVGFYLIFGPVLVPIFSASRAVRKLPAKSDETMLMAITAFYLALVGVDMLPNSMGQPIPLFVAGGLLSVSSRVAQGKMSVTGSIPPMKAAAL